MKTEPHEDFFELKARKPFIWSGIIAVVIAIPFAYLQINSRFEKLKSEKVQLLEKTLALQSEIEAVSNKNTDLLNELDEKENENSNLEKIVDRANNKIDTLVKLKETDKELLQKYSKIFFLNEHYTPKDLRDIDTEYLYLKDKPIQIHEEVEPHLERLLKRAKREDLDLKVISGYRSFGTQTSLKSSYKVTYGTSVANSFSADQGYSEHQLGTTIDFTTTKVGATFLNFDKTPEFMWLKENAYRYGFILSYPANNKYYTYEPWHWRFVGESLADHLHDENLNFYDMDQREIDEYLLDFFE